MPKIILCAVSLPTHTKSLRQQIFLLRHATISIMLVRISSTPSCDHLCGLYGMSPHQYAAWTACHCTIMRLAQHVTHHFAACTTCCYTIMRLMSLHHYAAWTACRRTIMRFVWHYMSQDIFIVHSLQVARVYGECVPRPCKNGWRVWSVLALDSPWTLTFNHIFIENTTSQSSPPRRLLPAVSNNKRPQTSHQQIAYTSRNCPLRHDTAISPRPPGMSDVQL